MSQIWNFIEEYWLSVIIGIMIFFIALASFKGCSSPEISSVTTGVQPPPGIGWFWLEVLLFILPFFIYASRNTRLAVIIFSVVWLVDLSILLGKFDAIFTLTIAGLPLAATACTFAYNKSTDGLRKFFGFATGIIILSWMLLVYLDYNTLNPGKINLDFLKMFLPDELSIKITVAATLAFIFATWIKNRLFKGIFYAISLFFILCILGNATINGAFDRFPERLTPPTELREGTSGMLKSLGVFFKGVSNRSMEFWNEHSVAPQSASKPEPQTQSYQPHSAPPSVVEKTVYRTGTSERPSREPIFVDWVRKGPSGIPTEIRGYAPAGEYYISQRDYRGIIYIQTPSGRIEGRSLIDGCRFFTREGERPYSLLAGNDVSLYRWKVN